VPRAGQAVTPDPAARRKYTFAAKECLQLPARYGARDVVADVHAVRFTAMLDCSAISRFARRDVADAHRPESRYAIRCLYVPIWRPADFHSPFYCSSAIQERCCFIHDASERVILPVTIHRAITPAMPPVPMLALIPSSSRSATQSARSARRIHVAALPACRCRFSSLMPLRQPLPAILLPIFSG